VQALTRPDEFGELLFKGTPYDFGGAVSDFIGQYYGDATAWTGCTFTLQQAGVHPEMPNCAVEIECPTDDDGAPAFVWLTARRLPGGKSKLVMTTESGDCSRSSQLRKALDGFLDALTGWGWIATPEDAATPKTEETVSPPPTVNASVIAEKILQLELDATEQGGKRYQAQQKAQALLQYTEDPALRARLEAILAMTVRISPPLVDRPMVIALPDPFSVSTGDGPASAGRRSTPIEESTPAGDGVSIEEQRAAGGEIQPSKRGLNTTTLPKAAMVKRLIALWKVSIKAGCTIVGILPRTYNKVQRGGYQAEIQKEIDNLTTYNFDDYLKQWTPSERVGIKNLYDNFWAHVKRDPN